MKERFKQEGKEREVLFDWPLFNMAIFEGNLGQPSCQEPELKARSQNTNNYCAKRHCAWAMYSLRKWHGELRYLPEAWDRRSHSHVIPWYPTPPYA